MGKRLFLFMLRFVFNDREPHHTWNQNNAFQPAFPCIRHLIPCFWLCHPYNQCTELHISGCWGKADLPVVLAALTLLMRIVAQCLCCALKTNHSAFELRKNCVMSASHGLFVCLCFTEAVRWGAEKHLSRLVDIRAGFSQGLESEACRQSRIYANLVDCLATWSYYTLILYRKVI